jgi:PAS domain S-box-containing protein
MTGPGRSRRTPKPTGAPPPPAAPAPALSESELGYSVLLEQASDAIVVTDGDFKVLHANARAREMFGFSPDEWSHMSARQLPTEAELAGHPLEIERLRQGEPVTTCRQLRRKDGTVFTAETNARYLSDGRIVAIVRDISGRLSTERRLAESEARYTAVVEHATVGITVTDAQWRFVEVNPRACEIFGRTREELLRLSVRDLAAPGELQRAPLREPELRAGLDSFSTRRVRRPDGTVRVVEIGARDLGGGHVVSIVTDVTERIEAEWRLAESEAHLARAQELAHFGTWEADLESYTGRWSPEMYRMYGIPLDRVPVTYEMFSEHQHPEDRGRVEQLIREVMAGGAAPRTYEHRVLRPDGSVRILRATVDAQRNADGRVVRLVGSSQDITEQRLLELQLREAQKLEAIGRLAGGVAHDFNNLLTVILGFVETMLDGMSDDDRQRAGAEQIRQAARRAAGLTQQLLAFGRRQMFRLEVFDLNVVLEEMREILRRLIGEQIEIAVSPGARRALIRADRGQIEQVVLNLALNARDAMPRGGRLDIATADADAPPGGEPGTPWLLLAVSDTGTGMSAEVQAHIFEPFYTTKDVGKGTGLGLATVHGIVSQTGGRIEVRSAPGQGACFLVYLPGPVGEAVPAPELPADPQDRGDETVLLVEDDAAVRDLVADVLRRRGYRVLEAVDGADAADLAGRHAGLLHLLVTDVVMPGMGGQDLARALLEAHPGLRVLLISGYSGERARDAVPPGRHVAFLQKPFSPGALARKVRELLDARAGGA